jgi:cytochrome P450
VVADVTSDPEIVTPPVSPKGLQALLVEQAIPNLTARLGIFLARRSNKPFRLGKRVIAVRHAHVMEVLKRDLDFGIAAVNADKIEEVNAGPFVLGMDRSGDLVVERQALYEALMAVDFRKLQSALKRDIDETLAAVPAGGEVDVVNGYARPIAARTARRLFGLAAPPEPLFTDAVRSIFGHTFLNIDNDSVIRDRAIKAGRYMKAWIEAEIADRRERGELGDDMLGLLLRQGKLTDAGARRTIGGMLVGSIDTTASAVAKIIKVMGRDPDLEVSARDDLQNPERLHGWCEEALRCWPHNPIVLRVATADTELGGMKVAKGTAVIAWTQAAMQDAGAFPDPRRLRPDRKPEGYLHLGAGLHPCAGRPVNRFQIPMLVGGLIGRGLARVGSMSWAGRFPDRLMVKLSRGA